MEKQNKEQNRIEKLEKAVKKQQKEIAKIKKQTERQKWWNVYLLWK